jgi:hypothetical protein
LKIAELGNILGGSGIPDQPTQRYYPFKTIAKQNQGGIYEL